MTTSGDFERRQLRQAARAVERIKYSGAYFQQEYWREDLPGREGVGGLSYDDPTHERRFSFLSRLLSHHVPCQSVLDAGCGLAQLACGLRESGHSVLAVDVAPVATNAAHAAGVPVVRASLESLPFHDNSVDLVVCLDVLEHLPVFDVQPAIQELVRVATTYLVASINLDNPYSFHPTILSRETWQTLFLETGGVRWRRDIQCAVQSECASAYPEYEFFVYEIAG